MEIFSIKYLSEKVLKEYCGRKKEGIIALLIDVDKEKIYPIPKKMEHVTFAALLLGKSVKELKENPSLAASLIPSTIEIENGNIVGIVTGTSGLELGLKVRHHPTNLQKAHSLAWSCINLSCELKILKIGNLRINKILFL